MTSNSPFVNRYISYPYQLPNYFWTYHNAPLLNPTPLINSYARLQYLQPFPPNYSGMASRNFGVEEGMTYGGGFVPQYSMYNGQKQLSPKLQEQRLIQHNKIQIKKKEKKEPVLIEISDEQNNEQPQKKPDTVTPHTTKEDLLPKSKQLLQKKPNSRSHQKQRQTLRLNAQLHQQTNHSATKEKKIFKFSATKIKTKNKQDPQTKTKRHIVSQRIAKRIEQQKGTYRLSKKQKNILEVTLLRETTKEILTGPQFQAKIPEFELHGRDLISRKNQIREDLLKRLYQESDDEDCDD